MVKKYTKKLTLSAMFIAVGLLLPMLTGQIPRIGNMLLPMHIPVLLCGLICGWQYGLAVGFIVPLMRSLIFIMPVLFPTAVAMSFELAAYGFFAGYIYGHSRWQCVISLYRALIVSMFLGRIVLGIANTVLFAVSGSSYSLEVFVAAAFVNAIPGIILQIVLIPAIMIALNRTGLVKFRKKTAEAKV